MLRSLDSVWTLRIQYAPILIVYELLRVGVYKRLRALERQYVIVGISDTAPAGRGGSQRPTHAALPGSSSHQSAHASRPRDLREGAEDGGLGLGPELGVGLG